MSASAGVFTCFCAPSHVGVKPPYTRGGRRYTLYTRGGSLAIILCPVTLALPPYTAGGELALAT